MMRKRTLLPSFLLATLGAGCTQILGGFDFTSTSTSSTSTSSTSGGSGGSSTSSTTTSSSTSGSGGSSTSSTATSSSSSSSSSSGTGGGCGAVRDVNGTETDTYVGAGMVGVKPNLTGALITILAGPTFETFTGVGAANGTFKVPAVPACEYYLTFLDPGAPQTVPVYYLTSSSSPDMSLWIAGRSTATTMTQPTPLSVSLTGLDPWATGDTLKLLSLGGGVPAVGLAMATGVNPVVGATTFSGSFDASKVFSPPNLIDGAVGDHTVVLQTETSVQSTYTTTIVGRSVNLTSFTMSNGAAAPLSTALTALPQNKTAVVDWSPAGYEALAAAVNPHATVSSHAYNLQGYVGVPSDGATAVVGPLLSFAAPLGSNLSGVSLAFGDPYLGDMFYVAQVVTTYSVPVTAPGATPANFAVTALYAADEPTFEAKPPTTPIVSPPTNILVDGQSGFAGGTLASTTPTITLSPPAMGTATHYTVRAIQLSKAASGGTDTNAVGEVWGKLTTLQLPKGLLASGQTYVFRVDAIVYPGTTADAELEPRWVPWPLAHAQALTAPFTAP